MKLTNDEMNTIKGLLHYLNDNFDGHGLIAKVELTGVSFAESIPGKGYITLDDAAATEYVWGSA